MKKDLDKLVGQVFTLRILADKFRVGTAHMKGRLEEFGLHLKGAGESITKRGVLEKRPAKRGAKVSPRKEKGVKKDETE